MPKYCSENEKVKRAYTFSLEADSPRSIPPSAPSAGLRHRQASGPPGNLLWSKPDRSGAALWNVIPMASC